MTALLEVDGLTIVAHSDLPVPVVGFRWRGGTCILVRSDEIDADVIQRAREEAANVPAD